MTNPKNLTGFALVLLLFAATIAQGTVPSIINYQGQLTDSLGSPVVDGSYSIKFTLYNQSVGGTPVWTETLSVQVTNGVFSVLLGEITALELAISTSEVRYLGVKVGSDPEISPRTMLVSVPYAMRVGTVDGASGGVIQSELTVGGTNTNSGVGSFVTGIGNQLSGDHSIIAGGEGNEVTMSFATISGGHTNVATAFNTTISGGGSNLASNSAATVGGGIGNKSEGDASTIAGGYINRVYGAKATVGGGFNNTVSGDFSTVPGGRQNSASGLASFAAGTFAEASHPGTFVWADDMFATFISTDSNQFLIRARGGVGIGTNAPTSALHVVPSGESAGQFDGDVNVSGMLTKGGGAFRIDHPLDPQGKYLQHSFVESPEMKNIYDGLVTLNNDGEATVRLPDYFEALNSDFRYQLTCVGGYAPVFIKEKIRDRQFTIAGGQPGLQVSWQITGIRTDKWANENRIQVEVDKLPGRSTK